MNRPSYVTVVSETEHVVDVSPNSFPDDPSREYRLAVEEYHANHPDARVEFIFRDWGLHQSAKGVTHPSWNWDKFIYRIAPEVESPLAAGHNPQGLTEAQVGVSDGWRLLERGEYDQVKELTLDIERRNGAHWNSSGWRGCFLSVCYRTKKPAGYYLPKPKPPKLAKGHNHDELTEAQVGVSDGWRLLEPGEIDESRREGGDLEVWRVTSICSVGYWQPGARGYLPRRTYRTQKPAGYYLPKPEPAKPRVPLTPADIPPVCWVRAGGPKSRDQFRVTQISPDRLYYGAGSATPDYPGVGVSYFTSTFEELFEDPEFQYSEDLKNWHPFSKES